MTIASDPKARSSDTVDRKLAQDIAAEAYIWGFPAVMLEVSRRIATDREAANGVLGQAPMNQLTHSETFPPASFRGIVRPNFDTLYSVAWLDLTEGPQVITLPRSERYHVFQIMDAWTEVFASPGTRMTGGVGGDYVVAGPDWHGVPPSNSTVLRSPTNIAWVIGRIQTNGVSDYEAVHSFQRQISLRPLGNQRATGREPGLEGVDPDKPPMTTVVEMDGTRFFAILMEILQKNLPHIHDQAIVARMRRIGLSAGEPYHFHQLSDVVQTALTETPAECLALIRERVANVSTPRNGWSQLPASTGYFGGDYALRAAIALGGLGANRPEDAAYPLTEMDSDGKPLTGGSRYTLHFPKDGTPPVDAFWSVTLYDVDGYPVENSIGRQAIGDRDDLRFNPDGSLDIYIQHESPGDGRESNWLPAPEDVFTLTMRCYLPRPEVASGDWAPPPVTRVP